MAEDEHTHTSLLKRISQLTLVLLLLFFSVNGYIQSYRNGSDLDTAKKDRSNLTQTLNDQSTLIKQLRVAIQQQNKILEKNGLQPIPIPAETTIIIEPTPGSSSSGRPTPQPSSSMRPSPSHKPTPRPSSTPSPDPTQTIKKTVCDLTGICAFLRWFVLIL